MPINEEILKSVKIDAVASFLFKKKTFFASLGEQRQKVTVKINIILQNRHQTAGAAWSMEPSRNEFQSNSMELK